MYASMSSTQPLHSQAGGPVALYGPHKIPLAWSAQSYQPSYIPTQSHGPAVSIDRESQILQPQAATEKHRQEWWMSDKAPPDARSHLLHPSSELRPGQESCSQNSDVPTSSTPLASYRPGFPRAGGEEMGCHLPQSAHPLDSLPKFPVHEDGQIPTPGQMTPMAGPANVRGEMSAQAMLSKSQDSCDREMLNRLDGKRARVLPSGK